MSLRLAPVCVADALAWIREHHAHHGPPAGGLFAVGCEDGERMACVGIAGRPIARMLARDPRVLEILRVASDRTAHAASKVVAALSRGGIALGYTRLVSYTLLGEAGTSYRAAGWWPVSVTETTEGWSSHPRATAGSHAQPGKKVRWEFGDGATRGGAEVDALVREAVGVVTVPARPVEELPLFRDATAP